MYYTSKVCRTWEVKLILLESPIFLVDMIHTPLHWRNPVRKQKNFLFFLDIFDENTKLMKSLEQKILAFTTMSDCVNHDVKQSVMLLKQTIDEYVKYAEIKN